MPTTIAHPMWLAIGLLMSLIGIWLIRWASRNNMASAIKDATVGAALDTLAKRGRPDGHGVDSKAKKVASYGLRNSMSQLFGATGFILLMAGLVTAVLGIFGT